MSVTFLARPHSWRAALDRWLAISLNPARENLLADAQPQILNCFLYGHCTMDPVSLGLGLAPLCLSAIEAAKYIRKRIKIIEDLQRELCRFRKRFKIQTGIFRDECHLLLQDAGTDDWLVEHMLDDFTHSHWTSPELEARMETHLGQRYKDAKVTVDEINSQIIALKKVLQKIENDNSIRAWAS